VTDRPIDQRTDCQTMLLSGLICIRSTAMWPNNIHISLLLSVLTDKIKSEVKSIQTSGPEFTILWAHVEEILLLNKFFFRLSIHALVAKI